jgi:hypothetical protein
LTWLAQRLHPWRERFYPDWMQPNWLSARGRAQFERRTVWSRWIVGLAGGLAAGLAFGQMGGLLAGLAAGFSVTWAGLELGATLTEPGIKPVEDLGWSWKLAMGLGLPYGLLAGMFAGVVGWLLSGVTLGELVGQFVPALRAGAPLDWLILELISRSDPTVWRVSGLVSLGWSVVKFGLQTRQTATPMAPLLGIRTARRAGLSAGLVTGVIAGLLMGLIGWLFGGLGGGVIAACIFGLTVTAAIGVSAGVVTGLSVALVGGVVGVVVGGLWGGLIVGVHIGLKMGGATYLRHQLLRRRIYKAGGLPANLLKFFAFSEERLLMRRAGGGYLFIHRLLMEHFAEGDPTNPIPLANETQKDIPEPSGWPDLLAHIGNKVNAVAFSPDGRWLATGSGGTARVWDITRRERSSTYWYHRWNIKAVERLRWSHFWNVNAVAFSPNGRWLATASDGRTVSMWDTIAAPPPGPRHCRAGCS